MFQKYNLISSPEQIKQVDDYLMNSDGTSKFPVIAFDTETNGLLLQNSTIIGFSFAVNKSEGFYLPILQWIPDPESKKMRTKDKVKFEIFAEGHLKCFWTGKVYDEFVKPSDYQVPDFIPALIQRWFGNTLLVMHNAPFDINQVFINYGVDLKEQLLADTGLLVHIHNENASTALKESAVVYRNELGINPFANAKIEKEELLGSILRNGGDKAGEVWRADLSFQAKYAAADTFLTFGLFEVILDRLQKEHLEQFPRIREWIFDQEVMPVCKEVVIDMKRRGVYVDVAYFQKLSDQNEKKLMALEDEFHQSTSEFMEGFDKGNSLDEAVSHQRLVKEFIKLEGLAIPKVWDKKSEKWKESLAKKPVSEQYEKDPHWVWGYILGQDEIKYSPEKVLEIKTRLCQEVEGKRYRFNMNSGDHLRWLFFTKLGENARKFPPTDGSTSTNFVASIDADGIKTHLLPKFPWVATLLKYKKIMKMQSTYISPALEYQINGWLYMDWKQNGTTSGRFSCSGGYNLQTLPRVDDELEALEACSKCFSKNVVMDEYIECMANLECKQCGHTEYDIPRPSAIKKGFIAPPGYKIVNADYSSLEPRCFAYVSGEDNIKAVYRDGLDLYSKVYCDMFDKEHQFSAHPDSPNFLKKVNKKARTWVKPLVLGIPYGAGDAQCANMVGAMIKSTEPNEHGIFEERPDMNEGKRVRELYLSTYPELTKYMNLQEYMAIQYGFVDAKYGRRRHFPWVKTIAEFFEQIPSHTNYDKVQRVLHFIRNAKSKLKSGQAQIRDFDTGNTVMNLTEEHLAQLAEKLGMSYSIDKYGKDGIKQKGNWSYIRSLLKADLNNAKNHPIQGLAGHITNRGMLDSNRAFKNAGLDAWVAFQVHDEITSYAREDQAEKARQIQQISMEQNIFTLPLRSEVVMIAEPVICDNLKESK